MSKEKLSLAFAGTPELAAIILAAIIDRSPHTLTSIYTQPDRQAGRGRKLSISPVKQLAIEQQLPVFQPKTPAEIDAENRLGDVDVFIVVAYGMILPVELIDRPTHGCINVHMSLLPRWRGAAPIQRAIQAGDSEIGVSIMQMEAGLDTGPILSQATYPISADDTGGSLHDRLAIIGAESLLKTLEELMASDLSPVPQDHTLATYAKKISKQEAEIDWSLPAIDLERMIRAFNPAPVAYTELNNIKLRIWRSQVIDQAIPVTPGKILDCTKSGIDIATGKGILRLLEIQPPGKRVQSVAEFLNGRPDFIKQARN